MATRPICPTLRPDLAWTCLAAALLAAGGCAGPLNQETGIGNAGRPHGPPIYTPGTITQTAIPTPLEGFEPTTDQRNAPIYGTRGPVAAAESKPSLVALDRDNWSSTRIDVPNDLTAHQPLMKRDYIIRDTDPRAQGRYPNERTALSVATKKHTDEQLWEGIASPFVAASNIVMMPVRAAMELRPMQPTRTGSDPYLRWPGQVLIVNPSMEPEGPAIPVPTPLPVPPAPKAAPPSGSASRPGRGSGTSRPAPTPQPQTPAEDLKPGGGMPATDTPIPTPAPKP